MSSSPSGSIVQLSAGPLRDFSRLFWAEGAGCPLFCGADGPGSGLGREGPSGSRGALLWSRELQPGLWLGPWEATSCSRGTVQRGWPLLPLAPWFSDPGQQGPFFPGAPHTGFSNWQLRKFRRTQTLALHV